MSELESRVVDKCEAICEQLNDLAPDVTELLRDYLREGGTAALAVQRVHRALTFETPAAFAAAASAIRAKVATDERKARANV